MSVGFDRTSDPGFMESLLSMSRAAGNQASMQAILAELQRIQAAQLAWVQFVALHGWHLIPAVGDNGYPGGTQTYRFTITCANGEVHDLYGYIYGPSPLPPPAVNIVVCTMAH
ncbi:TPA: hypothetical protein QDB45_005942 [Burkholderia vietnamiensis]|jgi:hypothetical protein|nr:hypothetical protein [Burkholderia vietnamiensis]